MACLFLLAVFGNVEHLGATLPGPGYEVLAGGSCWRSRSPGTLVSVILGTASSAQNADEPSGAFGYRRIHRSRGAVGGRGQRRLDRSGTFIRSRPGSVVGWTTFWAYVGGTRASERRSPSACAADPARTWRGRDGSHGSGQLSVRTSGWAIAEAGRAMIAGMARWRAGELIRADQMGAGGSRPRLRRGRGVPVSSSSMRTGWAKRGRATPQGEAHDPPRERHPPGSGPGGGSPR